MNFSRLVLPCLAASFAVLVACSADEGDLGASAAAATAAEKDPLLDVNDVSILFPAVPTPFPELRLDERVGAAGEQLFSQKHFDALVTFARGQGINFISFPGSEDRANWRVLGMRFDPCSRGLTSTGPEGVNGDRSKCMVEVRLIAQPLVPTTSPNETAGEVRDISAHFVYELGPLPSVDIEAIRADLVTIKDASTKAGATTDGEPLAVHPGLLARDQGVAEAVRRFITTYVAKATGARIAYIGTGNFSSGNWILTGGSLEGSGSLGGRAFVPVHRGPLHGLTNMPKGTPSESVMPDADTTLSPLPSNPSASAAALLTVPLAPERASALPQAKKDEIARVAFSIDDPSKHNFFTTNCFSCHIATARSQVASVTSTSARVRVPAGISGYLTKSTIQRSHYNFHVFSWFQGKPSVAMRTVNESVGIVAFLNQGRQVDGFLGPGKDCTSVDDAVWDCFAHAEGPQAAACASSCRPFPKR